ncbi:uncharacterized protein LOC131951207 [Physella acuta]|uniref:uncharacterized protein LOC131951207 n=1 Tax=Physella acuta TaxID=109671 RepID=UPI0027DB8607|nr:uncharacterized protein LOC131951207 [Physella acuta]
MKVSKVLTADIVKSLTSLWEEGELHDFTVIIDQVLIKCHRVILGACSHFFRGMLRSGMQEARSSRVDLQGISVATFQLVLHVLYTGEDVLNPENVLEVWNAANQLQIDFLVSFCENFAIKILSIENVDDIFRAAKLLNSTQVVSAVTEFIIKNFNAVREMPLFLELTCEELTSVLSSQELDVGNEDSVLESVLNWAECVPVKAESSLDVHELNTSVVSHKGVCFTSPQEYSVLNESCVDQNTPDSKQKQLLNIIESTAINDTNTCNASTSAQNPRRSDLTTVLKSIRTCLVCPALLHKLYKHEILAGNSEAQEIILNAILYQLHGYRHGQWPAAAVHRTRSDYNNYGVICHGHGIFKALSAQDEMWHELQPCAHLKVDIVLVEFDKELYATGRRMSTDVNSRMFVFRGNRWMLLMELDEVPVFLVAIETNICIIYNNNQSLFLLSPSNYKLELLTLLPVGAKIEQASSFKRHLVVFCHESQHGVDETAVYVLDIQSKTWTRVDNLEGPAKSLITFQDDSRCYVLQSNGSLWTMSGSSHVCVVLTYVSNLWDFPKVLHGAITYNGTLIIFGNYPKNDPEGSITKKSLEGYFDKISHWGREHYNSNFLPLILPKCSLQSTAGNEDINNVCNGYFKCLNKLWINEDLCDFTVQIDDVSIKCHRVILGACSPFFLGLLRSGMKEANDGRVVLQDISVSTFQLILKTLYTGEDVLSLDNFIEIWHAVDMLQIDFMVKLCEKFALDNLRMETFEDIYPSAMFLNSKAVLKRIKKFILYNFEEVIKTRTYLELSYNVLLKIIKSNSLKVTNEYEVAKSVLKWVEYKSESCNDTVNPIVKNCSVKESEYSNIIFQKNIGLKSQKWREKRLQNSLVAQESTPELFNQGVGPANNFSCISNSVKSKRKPFSTSSNERSQKLADLLKCVRLSLMSPSLLAYILNHHLVVNNDEARKIIQEAILNQTAISRHGQWSSSGIHRRYDKSGNYGVYAYGEGKYRVIDLLDDQWYTIKSCSHIKRKIQLVVFDNELHSTGVRKVDQLNCKMFVYCGGLWKEIVEMPGNELILVSNDSYIYVTNIDQSVIYRMNPRSRMPVVVRYSQIPGELFVTHVMSYQIYLLFFCTETVNGVEETAVHMLDLHAKSWTRLDNLNGPAKNIISFRNDDNHFVLQTNGNLWTLHETLQGQIAFNYVANLWNFQMVLYGAVVYGKHLIIFSQSSKNEKEDEAVYSLEDNFSSIIYWESCEACSNFIPAVLPKTCLY